MADVYNSQLDAFTLYHKTHPSSSPSSSSALPALGHALSGATGTAISNICLYPLDLVITRLQVQRQILNSQSSTQTSTSTESSSKHQNQSQKYKSIPHALQTILETEGLSGLYTGLLPDTTKSLIDSFLFFLFYSYLRTKRISKSNPSSKHGNLSALEELSIGALAGASAKFFTMPWANIVVGLQTHSLTADSDSTSTSEKKSISQSKDSGSKSRTIQNRTVSKPSITQTAKNIYARKGIRGFWSGYSASLILTLNPSLTFFLFEFFKRGAGRLRRDRSKPQDLGVKITFLMAAVAKALATSVTYPVSLVKARAQVDGSTQTKRKNTTVVHAMARIAREDGIGSLYEGIGGEVLKGFLGHGLTMILKDWVFEGIVGGWGFLVKKGLLKWEERLVEGVKEGSEDVMERIGEVKEKVVNGAKDVTEKITTATGLPTTRTEIETAGTNISEAAKNASGKIIDGAKDLNGKLKIPSTTEAGDRIAGVGNNISETAKDFSGKAVNAAKDLGDRVGGVGGDISESLANATDYTKKEAGHLLGNAGEQLGGKGHAHSVVKIEKDN